jgi:nitrate reductase gamma subunit
MLLLFLPVFAVATALLFYRVYKALSQSPTAVAPQEVARFLTFGGILNKRLRTLSLLFHIAIITSLLGHLLMFVEGVPPPLSETGTALGAVATVTLALLVARRIREKDYEYLFISLLLLLTAATGTAMGLVAEREHVVKAALFFPQSLTLADLLLVAHAVSATAAAAAVPYTLMSHVAAPMAYLMAKLRKPEKRQDM